MSTRKKQLLIAVLLILCGCSQEAKMPEVNEENCQKVDRKSLPESVRREFADKCFLGGGKNPFSKTPNPRTFMEIWEQGTIEYKKNKENKENKEQ